MKVFVNNQLTYILVRMHCLQFKEMVFYRIGKRDNERDKDIDIDRQRDR